MRSHENTPNKLTAAGVAAVAVLALSGCAEGLITTEAERVETAEDAVTLFVDVNCSEETPAVYAEASSTFDGSGHPGTYAAYILCGNDLGERQEPTDLRVVAKPGDAGFANGGTVVMDVAPWESDEPVTATFFDRAQGADSYNVLIDNAAAMLVSVS